MKFLVVYMALTILFLTWRNVVIAGTDTLKVQTALPYLNTKNHLVQDVFFESQIAHQYRMSVSCFQLREGNDSLLVYSKKNFTTFLKKGVHVYHFLIKHLQDSGFVHHDYIEILRRTGTLPAGKYCIKLGTVREDRVQEFFFSHVVDSALSGQSSIRSKVKDILSSGKQLKLFGAGFTTESKETGKVKSFPEHAYRKLSVALKRKKLDVTQRSENNAICYEVWYEDIFIGYYKTELSEEVGKRHDARRQSPDKVGSSIANDLENIQSIFGQLRELNLRGKEEKEVSGELGVSANFSNGQEEYAASENNYYELNGRLELPIMGIPIMLEGFYTSQDRNRQVKASYIRFHYDTERAKEDLLKLISGYNEKYERTVAKGRGLESVYQSYLNKLNEEKVKLLADIRKEADQRTLNTIMPDTLCLRQQLSDSILRDGDGSNLAKMNDAKKMIGKGERLQDSVEKTYKHVEEKYKRLQQLEQNIAKYQRLIEQYRTTTYFDSALVYDKLKELNTANDLSYKQLSKKAAALLPEGNAKRFVTGITHLDAGIFNKYESSYTLSGQNIKGVDAGYDFGVFQTAFTWGRIEYAGRDGSLDKYMGYSARVMFQPLPKQKASLVYYGYTPSARMLSEDKFFKDIDVSMPSFRSPVHIVSLSYSGVISRNVHFESEVATSFRKTDKERLSNAGTEKMAYNIKAEGDIPHTGISVNAGYEHVGRQFENNSAPVNLSGLERYTIGSRSVLFKNFLTLGVEYNYLEQQSFSGTGGNSKWGFEIKTNSRRYPSVGLSYKPFATFRSFNDTLDIPQRPLIGAVWTGKASYQLKKKTYTVRFAMVYNDNRSMSDTVQTHTSLFQVNTIWHSNKTMVSLNLSHIENNRSDSGFVHQNTKMLSLNAGYDYGKRWMFSGGLDVGVAVFGVSKLAGNLGCRYMFEKIPVMIQLSGRLNAYRLTEAYAWRQIVSGTTDLIWRFRFNVRSTD